MKQGSYSEDLASRHLSYADQATRYHMLCIVLTVVVVASGSLLYLAKDHPPSAWLLDGPWDDGRAFYTIARDGYTPGVPESFRELAFYPLVLRIFIPSIGVYSLFLVSVVSAVACSLLIYVISRRWYLSPTASFVFAMIFSVARLPTFAIPYFTVGYPPMTVLTSIQGSESIYLALSLASFVALKSHKTALAFLLVGLASVTRITGLLIAGGYCVVLLFRKQWRLLPWCVIPFGFVLVHFLYYMQISGDFFAFFRGHGEFYSEGSLTLPFSDLVRAFTTDAYRELWETRVGWLAIYCFCIVALVYLVQRDKLLFWIAAPSFLLFISLNGWALHARYYVTLWPIPLAYALWFTATVHRTRDRQPTPSH